MVRTVHCRYYIIRQTDKLHKIRSADHEWNETDEGEGWGVSKFIPGPDPLPDVENCEPFGILRIVQAYAHLADNVVVGISAPAEMAQETRLPPAANNITQAPHTLKGAWETLGTSGTAETRTTLAAYTTRTGGADWICPDPDRAGLGWQPIDLTAIQWIPRPTQGAKKCRLTVTREEATVRIEIPA